MAVSLPSGFGSASAAYLNNFPGNPPIEGFSAIKTTDSTDTAREINKLNFTKGMDLAGIALKEQGDLVEREMINEQSQWLAEKEIEMARKKNLQQTLANIWGQPTQIRMAGESLTGSKQSNTATVKNFLMNDLGFDT